MREFKDKVAVITGAASGIGRSLAQRCAVEGMQLVLADIEEQALALAAQELIDAGSRVLAVKTDVSRAEEVENLARKTLDAFGSVDLLFNNAGVGAGAAIWESSLADWEWVMGVNLWGTIHGIRAFVPLMLAQNTECHIVNTASIAGLISGSGLGIYKVTKHGIVSLSETLACELAERGAKIKVSVLCPMWVKTRIMESERNRPANLQNSAQEMASNPQDDAAARAINQAVDAGISPDQVAGDVFDAIQNDKFYILTHPESKGMVRKRMQDILEGRSPA